MNVRRTVEKEQQSRPAESEAGQAIIEFALTITMTLLLIFGMIDFSRAIYTASVIQWAAQQGARAGIIEDSSEETIRTAVHERMIGLYNCPSPEDCIAISYPSENIVQVDVTYDFEFVAPIVAQFTGDSIQIHSSASMIAH